MRNQDIKTKLPPINLEFWIMTLAATTLGSIGGDWLVLTMNLRSSVRVAIFVLVFLIFLLMQLRSKSHLPWFYWAAMISTSSVGTTFSNNSERILAEGQGLALIMVILLIMILSVSMLLTVLRWQAGEIDLAKLRLELFYWIAILGANSIGTELGELINKKSGFNLFGNLLLIGGVLSVLLITRFFVRAGQTILFWLAFAMTRPLGATLGAVLSKSTEESGLNIGRGYSSFALLGAMGLMMAYNFRKNSLSPELNDSI